MSLDKSEKDQRCAAEIEHVKDTAGKFLHQAIQENKKAFDDEIKKYRSQLDDDLRRRLVCLLVFHGCPALTCYRPSTKLVGQLPCRRPNVNMIIPDPITRAHLLLVCQRLESVLTPPKMSIEQAG